MTLRLLPVLMLFFMALISGTTAALSPEQRADGYLLEAQRAYKAGNYSTAVGAFEKIEALNVRMVDDFHFFYAMALSKSYRKESAWQQVKIYLNATGRNGSYYQKALSLYQSLRSHMASQAQSVISRADNKNSEWSSLHSQKSLKTNTLPWLNQTLTKAKSQLAQDNFEEAIKNAQLVYNRAENHRLSFKSRENKLQSYQKDIQTIESAVEQRLIDKTILTPHSTSQKNLSLALKKMDFKDYDLTHKVATKKMRHDLPLAKKALADVEQKHKNKVTLLKKTMQCLALKSKVDGYRGLQVTYKNNQSEIESDYRRKCGV